MPNEIALIVPVYNEAENLKQLAQEIAQAMSSVGWLYQLILVDDASRDDSWNMIKALCEVNPMIVGLRHVQNRGQSMAFWTGIQAATTAILGTMDSDLQNDPADLPKMLAALERFDFVCGVRVSRQDSWSRKTSSNVARWARRQVLGVDFRDTGCSLRVFRRAVLAGVFPFNGWHRFLPVLVHDAGFSTQEVEVHHRPRLAGVTNYGVWNRLGRGIWDLFGVAWMQKRRLRPATTERFPALRT